MMYEELLAQEGRYWGEVTRSLMKDGHIPYDVDRRHATHITDPQLLQQCGLRRSDPEAEEIWRGRLVDETIAALKNIQTRRVLELGAGAGWLALELARNGFEVDALDVSEERLRIARSYLESLPETGTANFGRVKYMVADLNQVKLPEQAYDAVVSFTTLHHVEENRVLMKQCVQALRPGSLLIIYDDCYQLTKLADWVRPAMLLLGYLLPSSLPLRDRWRRWFFSTWRIRKIMSRLVRPLRKGVSRQKNGSLSKNVVPFGGSPFEGKGGTGWMQVVQANFEVVTWKQLESFQLVHAFNFALPLPMRRLLYRVLERVDNAIAHTRLLRGTAVFIIARLPDTGE